MSGGEASEVHRIQLATHLRLQSISRRRLSSHPVPPGRYTVVGGVMPYIKTSRVLPTDGVKKGTPRTTPVRMPPPVKIPPNTPIPVQSPTAVTR
jgi:hypothetical protein